MTGNRPPMVVYSIQYFKQKRVVRLRCFAMAKPHSNRVPMPPKSKLSATKTSASTPETITSAPKANTSTEVSVLGKRSSSAWLTKQSTNTGKPQTATKTAFGGSGTHSSKYPKRERVKPQYIDSVSLSSRSFSSTFEILMHFGRKSMKNASSAIFPTGKACEVSRYYTFLNRSASTLTIQLKAFYCIGIR